MNRQSHGADEAELQLSPPHPLSKTFFISSLFFSLDNWEQNKFCSGVEIIYIQLNISHLIRLIYR